MAIQTCAHHVTAVAQDAWKPDESMTAGLH
ncbi:hypothetical protein N692_08095 [Lactiplantibacillus plantarum EGD-AQ4]|nr:hypothetical protein N692_08095 [Lactiplantibacillus plantarum EGD-AQ4]